MEQNVDAGVPVTPVIDNKQKNSNGLKIATAIACIAAVCGIGFGVYGMMQSSQKDSHISDLKVQIKEDDGTITTVETPEIETTTNNGTIVTITDTAKVSGGPYIENGYFYVPYWGVKFKLSDELTSYGFSVDQDSQGYQYDKYVVSLTGIRKSDWPQGPQQAQVRDNVFTCSMVTAARASREYIDSLQPFGGPAGLVNYGDDYTFVLYDNYKYDCIVANNLNQKDMIDSASEIILNDILSHPEAI